MRIPFITRRCRRHRSRGQSLVEFALVLPVILVLVLATVDFGRLFYSWVVLNNSARVGANYAAADPNGPFIGGSVYATDLTNEGFGALGTTCATSGVPTPTFTDTAVDGNSTTQDFGDEATVAASCQFKVITPIIAGIVGSNVQLTASSTFPIRVGAYVP